MRLIAELQRRKVFKVGAAYLVVAWLIVQAASIGFPAFDAPPWALRIFILIALLGFPAAVVMAWVFDVTREGVKLDTSAAGTKRLFAAAAVMMMLALAWYFIGQPNVRTGDAATVASDAKAPAKPEIVAAAVPEKSIAVLPFTDLSPGKDHDYFSDGMAEEILNALAQVEDLKVAGRTSSFSFRGKDHDLRAIGKALGVANILEGSVRKQGDKVRITAQLIRKKDGFHLWSETYDGELKDVFTLQENIAQAITGNLQVILQGDQKSNLVRAGTSNAQAYTRYLQAASIFNRRDGEHYPMAIAALNEAIRIDPEFARAHARLAVIHILMGSFQDANYDESLATSEHEARRALVLDPGLAEAHAALALKYFYQRKPLQALATMDKAVALDPQDPTANFWRGLMLLCDGYVTQGLASLDRTLAIDP